MLERNAAVVRRQLYGDFTNSNCSYVCSLLPTGIIKAGLTRGRHPVGSPALKIENKRQTSQAENRLEQWGLRKLASRCSGDSAVMNGI
jgi:hypothetical protein